MRDLVRFTADGFRPHRRYWEERAALLSDSFSLADFASPADGAAAEARGELRVALESESGAALLRACRRDPRGLYALALAGIYLTLWRYGGEATLVVLAPHFAAPVDITGLIPLVQRLRPGMSLRALLEETRSNFLDAMRYAEYSTDALLARAQGALVLVPPDAAHGDHPGFSIQLSIEGDTVALSARYAGVSMREAFARAFLEHLSAAMTAFLKPECVLGEVELLTPLELNTLTFAYAHGGGARHDEDLREAFLHQVERTPDAIALCDGDGCWTYRELGRWVLAMADILRAENGMRAGTRSGICMSPSAQYIVAILAVLEAGGSYVPLDQAQPATRLASMAEAAGVDLVLLRTGDARPAWFKGRLQAVLPDHGRPEARTSAPAARNARTPCSEAYVLFTSGSAGRPKGVCVSDRSVVGLVRDSNYMRLGVGDRVAQLSNPAFDGSVFDIFGALLNGATLHIVPTCARALVDELIVFLKARAINQIFLTTALFNRLVDDAPELIGQFDKLYFGGQDASLPHVRRALLHSRSSGALVHVYGPTETTTFATWHPIHHLPDGARDVPIGRPVSGAQVYVLNALRRPVPAGVMGEICIGGRGVALGYLGPGRDESDVFGVAPFRTGGRLYRTGDRGCWLADGTLRFLGRCDRQIKLRGHRVELGEIEFVLRAHPAVREAAVGVFEPAGKPEAAMLAAFVGTDDDSLHAEVLRGYLSAALPAYCVPARFSVNASLPLNKSGKVDLARLLRELAQDFTPRLPSGVGTPKQLAHFWATLLSMPAVGLDDDFFSIGGHSLSVAALGAEVRKRWAVQLTLTEIFQRPTPRALAALIDERRATLVDQPIGRVMPGSAPSGPQRAIWLATELSADAGAYLIPEAYSIVGPLAPRSLEAALQALVDRHEALRTTIIERNGELVAEVTTGARVDLVCLDAPEGADRHRDRESGEPLDLGRAPILRATSLRHDATHHTLLVTLHHAACDGWSLAVLFDELIHEYRARVSGSLPTAVPTGRSYRTVSDDIEREAAARKQIDLAYWSRQLQAPRTRVTLASDHARPAIRSARGDRRQLSLGTARSAAIHHCAQGHGSTTFAVLLAAIVALLHRQSGETDILVGVPLAGRMHPDSHRLVGCFVNTVVIRIRVDPEQGFAALLAAVHSTVGEALTHGSIAFDEVVRSLNPDRDPSRGTLFDVMVSMTAHERALPKHPMPLAPGVSIERLQPVLPYSRHDSTFGFCDGDDIALDLEYSTDVFSREWMERIVEQFGTLLDSSLSSPERPLALASLLTATDLAQLEAFETTVGSARAGGTILEAFEEHACEHGDDRAIWVDDGWWSYRDLAAWTDALAANLRHRHGVVAGSAVAVACDRSAWTVVAMYTVWKAGAVLVPVPAAWPDARRESILRDTKASVVLVDPSIPAVDCLGRTLVNVRRRPDAGARVSGTPLPTDVAYILHTSGTTGQPNGVLVTHRALANWVFDQGAAVDIGPDDCVLQMFSLSFDPALFFSAVALSFGASLWVASESELDNSQALADLVGERGVTVLGAIPSMLQLFSLAALAKVRAVVLGGEAPAPALLASLAPGRVVVNQYGATETTCVTAHVIRQYWDSAAPAPIGRPLPGVAVFVCDRGLQRLPIGMAGEIIVGGDGLAEGYLARPALDAERFVTVPWHEGKVFRTGDMGFWRPDGTLELIGRRDDQVKIDGIRIEPGEIEHALATLAGSEVAVCVLDWHGRRALVAFVEGDSGARTERELREGLRGKLPAVMVPSRIHRLARLPRNAHGKLDRSALRAIARAEIGAPSQCDTAEHSPNTDALVRVWTSVLGSAPAGPNADFFLSGGSSLTGMLLLGRLRSEHDLHLPLRQLFAGPTVGQIAAALRASTSGADHSPDVDSASSPDVPSHVQRRFWLFDQTSAAPETFVICGLLFPESILIRSAIEQALTAIVHRHEVLRTALVLVSGCLHQQVAPIRAIQVTTHDLRTMADPLSEARRRALETSRIPFDLASGLLLRATILHVSPEQDILLFSTHHVACDGHAMQTILHELIENYQSILAGIPVERMPARASYRDFAAWHERLLRGSAGAELKAYWMDVLCDPPPLLELPMDEPRPALGLRRLAGVVSFSIEASRADAIRAFGHRHGATPYVTVFAAITALMYRYSGQRDIVLGLPFMGRDRPEFSGVVGCFINPLPVRVNFNRIHDVAGLLGSVRDACLGAFAHQLYPFDEIVDQLGISRVPGRMPLFEIGLTWVPEGRSTAWHFEEVVTVSHHDLWFHATEDGAALRFDIEFDADRFSASRIRAIATDLECVLALLAKGAISRLEDLTAQARAYAAAQPIQTRYEL
jgi:amino acid adenylation domain-containing protein